MSYEINSTKDLLEKNNRSAINNSTYNTNAYDYVVLIRAKASFIEELKKHENELIMLNSSQETILLNTIEVLKKIKNEYLNKITNTQNLTDLNKYIIEFRTKIWKELEVFINNYCQKYNINTDTTILTKHSLKKLYDELEKIRKEQSQNNSILEEIEEEYRLYEGYNVIKENIHDIKKQILSEYNDRLYSEEAAKRKFSTKILLELKEYYRRLELSNSIEEKNNTKKNR